MATPINPALITECMLKFKNHDPKVWETFIRVLDQYVTEITVAVTEAPTAEILEAKGRAQQARKFFRLFTEFPQ